MNGSLLLDLFIYTFGYGSYDNGNAFLNCEDDIHIQNVDCIVTMGLLCPER